jgi:hypothetical protein
MPFVQPKPANLLQCPNCGNDTDFFEVNEEIVTTTRYVQNSDGSFTPVDHTSETRGEARLFCGNCEEDLTFFHPRFSEMIF